jgi:hypothetical protein
MINCMTVSSVADLLKAVSSAEKDLGRDLWYRGHRRTGWKLVPRVLRDDMPQHEQSIALAFRAMAATRYASCPPVNAHDQWLSLMQHHGAPTRLLDWTCSPLVAAFFVVLDDEDSFDDGCIWAMKPEKLNSSQLATKRIRTSDNQIVSRILAKPFSETTDDQAPKWALAFQAQETSPRMMMQGGQFTVHGRPEPLDAFKAAARFLWRFDVPQASKATLAGELDRLGIRRHLLFPDLDNLARELVSAVKRGQAMESRYSAEIPSVGHTLCLDPHFQWPHARVMAVVNGPESSTIRVERTGEGAAPR